MQEFLANLKKYREENITPVGEIKLPLSCSNQVGPSTKPRQEEDEASQIGTVNHDRMINSVSTISSVIEKAEANSTCAESIVSK